MLPEFKIYKYWNVCVHNEIHCVRLASFSASKTVLALYVLKPAYFDRQEVTKGVWIKSVKRVFHVPLLS